MHPIPAVVRTRPVRSVDGATPGQSPPRRSRFAMRKIAAIAAIVIGAGMLVVPVATKLWSRTDGAEVTFDTMRPLVSDQGLALAHRNFGVVQAGGTQFLAGVEPATAKQFGVSGAELNASLATNYPDIARGAKSIPGYLNFVGPTIDSLDAGQ